MQIKKVIFLLIAAFGLTSSVFAQSEQTKQGNFMVETMATMGSTTGGTGFMFSSVDGNTNWNLGGEVGYFVKDNLAIKAGLGYGSTKLDVLGESVTTSTFSYGIGAKYYIINMIPVQLDFSGTSIEDADENPSYVGISGGYAFFMGDMVSLEPSLRYNLSMNDNFEDAFIAEIGFSIFF